jgi:hypothetical protein
VRRSLRASRGQPRLPLSLFAEVLKRYFFGFCGNGHAIMDDNWRVLYLDRDRGRMDALPRYLPGNDHRKSFSITQSDKCPCGMWAWDCKSSIISSTAARNSVCCYSASLAHSRRNCARSSWVGAAAFLGDALRFGDLLLRRA